MELFKVEKFLFTGRQEASPYIRRDFYKIWVLEGRSTLHYADRSVVIDRPALIFTNPLVPYSLESEAPERKGYKCIFTEPFLKAGSRMEILRESTLFRPGSDKVFFPDKVQMAMVRRTYEDMIAEYSGEYAYKYDVLRSYVALLIHFSLKLQPVAEGEVHGNAASRIATSFLDLLEKQFPVDSPDQELKLKRAGDYADSLSVHVNHLNHAVKEVTGKSPSTLIADRIVNEARALLKYTDWSVATISDSLGFEYPTYFNNFFKKHTGVTPLSLRKQAVI
ncbi:MAG: AraC family transcriptional regulator [Bacteroidetes bacterium]|nr:AraC family transcriptional regulator [Bacteroidota bacterium]